MQDRITNLIGSITNENIIGELLRINDELNGLFIRYEKIELSKDAALKSDNFILPIPRSNLADNASNNKTTPILNLIDFGDDNIKNNNSKG